MKSVKSLRVAVASLVLSVSLAGCGQKAVSFPVKLITQTCSGTAPLEGASHLRFRVTGEGMEPIEFLAPVNAREQQIPEIPAGPGRIVEVRAYNGDPATGSVALSLGRSAPFDVPDVIDPAVPPPATINVFLRRANEFTAPNLADAPETCAKLLFGRAAHTATRLQDGRVMITGGFQLTQSGVRNMLATAEYFNPATGAFEAAPELGLLNSASQFSLTPRAFHTATLLPNGHLFLAGGEVVSGANTFPLKSALVFDPVSRRYGGLELQSARAHHGAALGEEGRVLLVGGVAQSGPVEVVEWYDAATAQTQTVAGALPRVGMSVVPVQNGKFIAVAGGSDGLSLTNEIRFYSFAEGTFAASTATARLRQLRSRAGAAVFQDANQLVLAGGYASADEAAGVQPLASSEILSTGSTFKVSEGPAIAPRGDVCAAKLEDGRVLTLGGRGSDGLGGPQSSASVELIIPSPSGAATVLGAPSLAQARHFHSCTTLADGSVLVTGGLHETPSGASVLQDAWIYMPAPLD